MNSNYDFINKIIHMILAIRNEAIFIFLLAYTMDNTYVEAN